jgi:hypothetical protein
MKKCEVLICIEKKRKQTSELAPKQGREQLLEKAPR